MAKPPRDSDAALLCRERGIAILSDEIYHGLSYVGPVPSMLQFEPEAMVVNSFSKYWSMAGWRLGWLILPEEEVQQARAQYEAQCRAGGRWDTAEDEAAWFDTLGQLRAQLLDLGVSPVRGLVEPYEARPAPRSALV